jgi:diadenosine tetraphosphate (Ap4A) HIT family hydrolase
MSFERLKIKEYKHWSLFLNENQSYLGRVCLVAKREDAVDLFDITEAEREELFLAGAEINQALKALFQPDLMNYASLGNSFRHLHVHFIPRYSSERSFQGMKFSDVRWGKNYEPYNRDFKLSDEALNEIKTALQNKWSP